MKVDLKNLVNDVVPANESFTTEDMDAEPIQNKTLNNPSCETELLHLQCICKFFDHYDPQIIDSIVSCFFFT